MYGATKFTEIVGQPTLDRLKEAGYVVIEKKRLDWMESVLAAVRTVIAAKKFGRFSVLDKKLHVLEATYKEGKK